MRKSLFLLLITGVWGSTQAQTSTARKSPSVSVNLQKLAQMRIKANSASEKQTAAQPSSNSKSTHSHRVSNEPLLPPLGSSANVNGVRDATTTATTANQACNLITMTHRENNSNVGTCGTGAYNAAYSTNGGATWDSSVTISCNQPSRYPNGVLFNPAGNTNPMNVYDAMSGPWTNSSTTAISWVETVYGSVTIGNTNSHEMFWTNGISPNTTPQNTGNLSFMSSSDDSTVHVIGEGYSLNSTGAAFQAWYGAVMTTGKFNAAADSFNWYQTVFRPHLVPAIKGFGSMSLPYDSSVFPVTQPGQAWSQDGKTGYVVIFGNLDSSGVGYNYNFESNQPIVYKTTNSGQSWAMMPMYNFRNIASLTQFLTPSSDSGVAEPLWYTFAAGNFAQGANNDWDLTVDMNGNLHIFSAILSSYYTNPDSGYAVEFYAGHHGYIYDVYTTTGTGGWQARYIDSMTTYPAHVVTNAESNDWDNTSSSSVAFGNRLQASRTTDGSHVFVTWEDDTTGATTDSLVSPDVKGQGYDVANDTKTMIMQFTHSANNYYLCASDIALTSGSSNVTYTVPATITYPQTIPSDGSTAVNYFYLGSIQYNDNMFTGIPAIAQPGFSITANYPNPFNHITSFNVNLTKESEVSVEVYNLIGEKVYTIGAQKMTTGSHLMTLDGSGWSSGVYFYKVIANNQSITQKMVVQK